VKQASPAAISEIAELRRLVGLLRIEKGFRAGDPSPSAEAVRPKQAACSWLCRGYGRAGPALGPLDALGNGEKWLN